MAAIRVLGFISPAIAFMVYAPAAFESFYAHIIPRKEVCNLSRTTVKILRTIPTNFV